MLDTLKLLANFDARMKSLLPLLQTTYSFERDRLIVWYYHPGGFPSTLGLMDIGADDPEAFFSEQEMFLLHSFKKPNPAAPSICSGQLKKTE